MNKPRFRAEQLLQDASSACGQYEADGHSIDQIKGMVDPLPLLIRRHGLAITLKYLEHQRDKLERDKANEAQWIIEQAFSLDRWLADGIPGDDYSGRNDYICKCPARQYGVLTERMYAVFEALRAAVQAHASLSASTSKSEPEPQS